MGMSLRNLAVAGLCLGRTLAAGDESNSEIIGRTGVRMSPFLRLPVPETPSPSIH